MQPRKAVSLWSGDHNDSLKYDSWTCDQEGKHGTLLSSLFIELSGFGAKMLFSAALYIERAESTLSARGIVLYAEFSTPEKLLVSNCIKMSF